MLLQVLAQVHLVEHVVGLQGAKLVLHALDVLVLFIQKQAV